MSLQRYKLLERVICFFQTSGVVLSYYNINQMIEEDNIKFYRVISEMSENEDEVFERIGLDFIEKLKPASVTSFKRLVQFTFNMDDGKKMNISYRIVLTSNGNILSTMNKHSNEFNELCLNICRGEMSKLMLEDLWH